MILTDVLINSIPLLAQAVQTNYINQSQTCLICGAPGHNFDDCPAMKEPSDVKTAYIKL